MRSIISFDSFQTIKELKDSGMGQKEAEVIARVLSTAFTQLMETKEISTKSDLTEICQDVYTNKMELKQEFIHSHNEMKQCIFDTRDDMRDEIVSLKSTINCNYDDLKKSILALDNHFNNHKLDNDTHFSTITMELKYLESEMKAFIIRTFVVSVSVLTGIQAIMHFFN